MQNALQARSIPFDTSGYTLEGVQLFEGTDHRAIAGALADCPVLRVKHGQNLEGHTSQGPVLHVVLHGALNVARAVAGDATGSACADSAALKVLPGECVGELSVLDEEARSDQLMALMDSDVLVIEAEKLWKLVDESNGVARNLLRLLSFRVRAAGAQARRNRKVGEFYRQLSLVDALTGLQNRTWLNEHLPTMVENAHVVGSPMAVIMVDLDSFKQFNDLHGHVSGDHALQVAARVIRDGLRPTDFAARFGGEEMIVILPATQQKSALMVAQRLRDRLRQAVVFSELRKPLPHITASFGVATLEPGQHAEALISAAGPPRPRAQEDGPAGRERLANPPGVRDPHLGRRSVPWSHTATRSRCHRHLTAGAGSGIVNQRCEGKAAATGVRYACALAAEDRSTSNEGAPAAPEANSPGRSSPPGRGCSDRDTRRRRGSLPAGTSTRTARARPTRCSVRSGARS